MVRVVLRKRVLCIRFRRRDLVQLDELAKNLGLSTRSRLVNIALEGFLDRWAGQPCIIGPARPVKILLDLRVKERLDEMASRSRTPKSELARIAIKELAETEQWSFKKPVKF